MLDVNVILDFFPYGPLGGSTLVSRYSTYKLPWSVLLCPRWWTSTSPSSCGSASGPYNPKPGTKRKHFLTFDVWHCLSQPDLSQRCCISYFSISLPYQWTQGMCHLFSTLLKIKGVFEVYRQIIKPTREWHHPKLSPSFSLTWPGSNIFILKHHPAEMRIR